MRLRWVFAVSLAVGITVAGQDLSGEARKLEAKGDGATARDQLRRAAERAPNDPLALEAYAEFLDSHRDPGARDAYQKLRDLLARNGASASERARVARRLAILDLLAGDRISAAKNLNDFRSNDGIGLALPDASEALKPRGYIEVPGPLHSFERMAAISPDIVTDEVLASLAHNVMLNGYSATRANETLEPTEYLKLINRYLSQARELEKLAGTDKVLRIEMCESTQTGDLLRILGYRMRGGCGSDVVLETVNASRAFLTIDSGFPLSELEEALRTNRPFTLDYHPARLPILFGVEYWQPAPQKQTQNQPEFIDFLLGDPALCRLYAALSALDPDTAEQMRKDTPAQKLKVYAHVIDFFGGLFEIRGGKAVTPGGPRSEKAWADLVGTSPDKGAAFFERIIERDDGWVASYFDSLARINGPVQDYLTEPEHLKRFYTAIRGRVTSPGPARPVFRSNTDLILLTARLRLDPDGKPHLPGGLDTWKALFAGKTQSKYDPRLAKAAPGWKEPEEVLEGLFGLARKATENEPLKIFMALNEIDRNRAKPLEPATVDLLVREYKAFGQQYSLFAETPFVSEATIVSFIDATRGINQIHDVLTRSDAAGTFQSLASFWQIFVRQGSIPDAEADATLGQIIQPFKKIASGREVFEAGESGVRLLLKTAHAPTNGSAQDHMLDLLAGTKPAAGELSDAHQQMLEEMTSILEAQRLVSLDAIFDLADRLESAAGGQKPDTAQIGKLATRVTEVQLPRSSLTVREKTELAAGYWTDRHLDSERKLNLRAVIEKAGSDPQKLREARGLLAPVLRDTLVGLNYAHYAPPGAQILYTNSTFVRSHDFFGSSERQRTWSNTEVFGSGWPANAGGRLVGSLVSLPYALAEAEQNFLIPSREQALIWGDLVPQMIITAVIPRWWTVTPLQLHWVGLHMAYGESVLAEAALSENVRNQTTAVLDRYIPPARRKRIESRLASGDVRGAEENVIPSELYLLARELAPNDRQSAIANEIRIIAAESPNAVNPRVISHAFGTPKPMLSNSYEPELLNLRTFPTLMGYSSRILAESWESNLLFYGALADQVYIRPEELNLLVPAWTRQTVERIFATHLEDWPALLRSLRLVGEDVKDKTRKQQSTVAVN